MSTTTGHVAESLFGRIRRELLSILLLNPGRSFFLLELVALLRTGRGGVQRELANLTECGIAAMERLGSRTYYAAAPDAPLLAVLTAFLRASTDPHRILEAFADEVPGTISFAVASPASTDSGGRPVLELLLSGRTDAGELKAGIERIELLSGSTIRWTLVAPEDLQGHLSDPRRSPWLTPEGGILLKGEWPVRAEGVSAPAEECLPDLFSSMGLDWER